jgi:hypothetical protein
MLLTLGSPAIQLQLVGNTSNYISQPFIIGAGGSLAFGVPANMDPWWQSLSGDPLQLLQNGTTTIKYDIWYLQRS